MTNTELEELEARTKKVFDILVKLDENQDSETIGVITLFAVHFQLQFEMLRELRDISNCAN